MATLAYRMTEEYKDWKRAIKQDFPTMPDILIDYAIMAHKTNPKLYQNEYKDARRACAAQKAAALEVKTAKSPVEIVGAVKIYESEDDPDFPKAVPIKTVEV